MLHIRPEVDRVDQRRPPLRRFASASMMWRVFPTTFQSAPLPGRMEIAVALTSGHAIERCSGTSASPSPHPSFTPRSSISSGCSTEHVDELCAAGDIELAKGRGDL